MNSTSADEIVQILVVNQPDANFQIVCEIDGTVKSTQALENTFENHNCYSINPIHRKIFKRINTSLTFFCNINIFLMLIKE